MGKCLMCGGTGLNPNTMDYGPGDACGVCWGSGEDDEVTSNPEEYETDLQFFSMQTGSDVTFSLSLGKDDRIVMKIVGGKDNNATKRLEPDEAIAVSESLKVLANHITAEKPTFKSGSPLPDDTYVAMAFKKDV